MKVGFGDLYEGNVFIDTSALVALCAPKDQKHNEAAEKYASLKEASSRFFTSTLTISETYTRLRYDYSWEVAWTLWDLINDQIIILESSKESQVAIKEILKEYRGLKLSFHDACCAFLMLENKIATILTFDSHFKQLGFRA